MDVVIPIVFPDYLIAVATPEVRYQDPFKLFQIHIKSYKMKLPKLGHAGVLFAEGKSCLTKYYEYGRYDKAQLGLVRKLTVPDAESKEGGILPQTLRPALLSIAVTAGQGGRIQGAYIAVENRFTDMLSCAEARMKENANPKRERYDLDGNSCIHFVKSVVEAGGVDTPWMLDPRPNAYIGEFRDDFLDLDYDRKSGKLLIEGLAAG